MTSNNTISAKQTTHNHRWQTFIEFILPRESGSAPLATDLVIGTVQTLNWPVVHLEQLKLALGKAIQNALERDHPNNSAASLIIRTFIPEGGEGIKEADWPGDEPRQHLPSTETVQQVRRSPSGGWGFFLVQKQGDDPQAVAGESHHVIELFLYQESHLLFRR